MATNNILLRFTTAGVANAKKDIGGLSNEARELTASIDGSAGGLMHWGGIVKGVVLGAVLSLGTALFDIGSRYEQYRNQLTTALQSQELAAGAFEELRQLAAETPFEVENLTKAYIRLANLGLAPSRQELITWGDIAAAMGKDVVDWAEAVADASTGEFERLKEFGIKASAQGSQVSLTFRGVTQTVGRDAESIVGALRKIGEENFGGGMAAQSATAAGALSNLRGDVAQVADTMFRAGMGKAVEELARQLSDLANSDDFQAFAGDVGRGAGAIIQFLGSVIEWIGNTGLSWRQFRADTSRETAAILTALADANDWAVRSSQSINEWGANLQEAVRLRTGVQGLKFAPEIAELRALSAEQDRQTETLRIWAESYAEAASDIEAQIKKSKDAATSLNGVLDRLAKENRGTAGSAQDHAKAQADLEKSLKAVARALGDVDKITRNLADGAFDRWGDSVRRQVDALEEYRAKLASIREITGKEMADTIRRNRETARNPPLPERGEIEERLNRLYNERLISQGRFKALAQETVTVLYSEVVALEEGAKKFAKWIDITNAVVDTFATSLTHAIDDLIDGQIRSWEDLGDAIVDIFRDVGRSVLHEMADTLSKIIADWAKRKIVAKIVTSGSGGSGNDGIWGDLGTSATKSAVGSGLSATGAAVAAILGTVAVFGAAYYLGQKLLDRQSRKQTAGTVTLGAARPDDITVGYELGGLNDQLVQIARDTQAAFDELADLTGGSIRILERVKINVKGTGEIFVHVGSLVRRFTDLSEAVSFAKRELLRTAELSGLPEEIARLFREGAGQSFEELLSDIELINRNLGRGTTEMDRQVMALYAVLDADIERLAEIGIASSGVLTKFSEDLKKLAAEEGFSAAIEKLRARLARDLEQLRAELERALNAPTGGGGRSPSKPSGDRSNNGNGTIASNPLFSQAVSDLATVQDELGRALGDLARVGEDHVGVLEQEAAGIERVVAGLGGASSEYIDELRRRIADLERVLGELPQATKPPKGRGSGQGAGNRRREDQEDVRDFLARQGATSLDLALMDLGRRFEDLREKAHKNKDLLAQLTDEYERQAAAIRKQAIEDFYGRLNALGAQEQSPLAAAFGSTADEMEALRAQAEELAAASGWSAERIDRLRRRIEENGAAADRAAGQDWFLAAGDRLAALLDDEDLAYTIQNARYQLEVAQMRLDLEAARVRGVLTQQEIDLIEDAIGRLPALLPRGDGPPPPDNWAPGSAFDEWLARGFGEGGGTTSADELARRREDALEQLRDLERQALPPLTRELLELGERFDEIREVLGDTAQVQAAYSTAVQQVLRTHLQGIQELYDSTALQAAGGTAQQTYESLSAQFEAAAAALLAGDFSGLDDFSALAAQVQQLLGDTYAEGSGAYQTELLNFRALLAQVLGLGALPEGTVTLPGPLGSLPGGNSGGSALTTVQLTPGADAALAGLRATAELQLVELRGLRAEVAGLRADLRQRTPLVAVA